MKKFSYIILIALTMTSCFDKKQERRNNVYRPEFDISNDNRNIICSFYQNDNAIIYEVDVTNNQKTKISPTTEYSLIRPVYSPDNKKVACLAESLNDEIKTKICLIDLDSKKMVELTNYSLLILECVFNPNGQSIYFTAAKYFGNHSPVARKAPHQVDIYNIEIATKKIQKITNFDSYELHGLSINIRGDSLLFHLTEDNKDGLYMMDIKNKNLQQIYASNDLRVEKKATAYQYYSPVLSRDNSKIAFTEPYELYIMDRQTRISKLIFRNEPNLINIGSAKFFYSSNYLMVSIPTISKLEKSTGDNFGFYTINPETAEIKTLDL